MLFWFNLGWGLCAKKDFRKFKYLGSSGQNVQIGRGKKFVTHRHKLFSISESTNIWQKKFFDEINHFYGSLRGSVQLLVFKFF